MSRGHGRPGATSRESNHTDLNPDTDVGLDPSTEVGDDPNPDVGAALAAKREAIGL